MSTTPEVKHTLETTAGVCPPRINLPALPHLTASPKFRNRKQLLWPIAGISLGAIVSTNPFYQPHLSLKIVTTALIADMALVLILSAHRISGRIGILLAGMFFTVPCFLHASPLSRALLMCGMALPFAIATGPLLAPPTAGFRTRLAYFFTWLGTRKIERRPPALTPQLCSASSSPRWFSPAPWAV